VVPHHHHQVTERAFLNPSHIRKTALTTRALQLVHEVLSKVGRDRTGQDRTGRTTIHYYYYYYYAYGSSFGGTIMIAKGLPP